MDGIFFILPGEPIQFTHIRPSVFFHPFFQTAFVGDGVDIGDALLRTVMTTSFMEEGKKGLAPASKESIEMLPTVSGDESECSICLESLKELTVKEMPCKHRFHGDCLDKWLGIQGSCPLCRFQMDSETKSNDGDRNT